MDINLYTIKQATSRSSKSYSEDKQISITVIRRVKFCDHGSRRNDPDDWLGSVVVGGVIKTSYP